MDQYEYKAGHPSDHYPGVEAGVLTSPGGGHHYHGLTSPPPLYPSPGEAGGLQSASSLSPEARSDARKTGHIYH